MSKTVVVVGGGYGGVAAAKALDAHADVVLVEPRDTFVHNIAVLRGVVDPAWIDPIFMPYDQLLQRGRVVRGRATTVTDTGVRLDTGAWLPADYVILATGSSSPFPAKPDADDAATTRHHLREAQRHVERSAEILLLGAGPIGLELSGEIKSAWPDKRVTIVDPSPTLLPRLPEEFRTEVRRQLDSLGITVLSSTRLAQDPPSPPGEHAPFNVRTENGGEIRGDFWLRCFGVHPHTDYLGSALTPARQTDGLLDVTPELRLAGHDTVFVVGDIANLTEAKMAGNAIKQAEVVAENVRRLITGETDLATHAPDGAWLLLPLGPKAGASYVEGMGVLDPQTTAEYKGHDLMIPHFRAELGLDG